VLPADPYDVAVRAVDDPARGPPHPARWPAPASRPGEHPLLGVWVTVVRCHADVGKLGGDRAGHGKQGTLHANKAIRAHQISVTVPSRTTSLRVTRHRSARVRSWVTIRSVPSYRSSASSSCSIAGRSRWLVGSSSTSRLAPECMSKARSARVRSPGD